MKLDLIIDFETKSGGRHIIAVLGDKIGIIGPNISSPAREYKYVMDAVAVVLEELGIDATSTPSRKLKYIAELPENWRKYCKETEHWSDTKPTLEQAAKLLDEAVRNS